MRCVWLVALFGVASGVPVATREVATELKEDDCQKYVSIKESEVDPKSKAEHLQVDDGYCEANCKKGYCPKESCKCDPNYVPPDPAKPKVVPVRTMTPTEERAAAAIKDADEAREKAEADDASGADAALKEREAIAKAAEDAREERDAALAKAAEERMQQAEKDRLAITPLTAADAAADALAAVPAADAVAAVPEADAVAAVPDAVAAVPEVSADWAVVAAVPAAAVPEVSPPVVPVVAVFDPKSCKGSFVAINQPADGDNALFTQPDDAYCDANCNGGFCPEDKCRCSTDA